jgi:gliding motility-associated lipoprotein GldD
MKVIERLGQILCSTFLLSACSDDYTPKPRGYFMMDFPERGYQQFSNPDCPCTFEYPLYARVIQEKNFFEDTPEHPCWLNIEFPSFNATIYLSYKDVRDRKKFEKVISDSYMLTFKHSNKADFIDEQMIEDEQRNIFGYLFEVGGDAASGAQFFATDSVEHFLRGALYFRVTPNSDSLQPAQQFLEKDMLHLIETLQWK